MGGTAAGKSGLSREVPGPELNEAVYRALLRPFIFFMSLQT